MRGSVTDWSVVASGIAELGRKALVRWVALAAERPRAVAGLVLLLAATALALAVTRLSINTSTTDMLSPELPFRRNLARLRLFRPATASSKESTG